MKILRLILLATLVLLVPTFSLQADERSAALLKSLEKRIGQMAGYEVEFTLHIEGREIAGNYRVKGDSFYMQLADAEVYSDGKDRFEVDPTKREVVIDPADLSSHNILQNPTRAFTYLEDEYNHELQSEAAGRATLTLKPKSRSSISQVTLVMDIASSIPQLLRYEADGEALHIRITHFKESNPEIPLFDPSRYPDYELIDFR